ncbi:unnamed protein product [Musa acuminata subsp. burmannicoides]
MADQTVCCNLKATIELIGLSFSGFVVLFVVFVYVRYRLLPQLPPAGPAHDRRPTAGLDPSAVAALPSFAYRHGDGDGKGKCTSLDCAVCLSTVDEGETLRMLPACQHTFHAECIDRWLLSSSTCPVCRTEADSSERSVATSSASSATTIGETSSSSSFPGMWSGRRPLQGDGIRDLENNL